MHNGIESYYNVCPEIGSLLMTVNGTYGGGQWTVPENNYRWFRRSSHIACGFLGGELCRYDKNMTITQADYTYFNTTGYFDW